MPYIDLQKLLDPQLENTTPPPYYQTPLFDHVEHPAQFSMPQPRTSTSGFPYELAVKVVMIGDAATGKSTILQQFARFVSWQEQNSSSASAESAQDKTPTSTVQAVTEPCAPPATLHSTMTTMITSIPVPAAAPPPRADLNAPALPDQGTPASSLASPPTRTTTIAASPTLEPSAGGSLPSFGSSRMRQSASAGSIPAPPPRLAKIERVMLRVWDMPGLEAYQQSSPSCFSGAAVVLCVFSVTDRLSYVHVGDWLTAIRSFAPPRCVIALVANTVSEGRPSAFATVSLLAEPEAVHVSTSEASRLAADNGLFFFPCNARTGEGVVRLLHSTVGEVVRRVDAGEIDPEDVANGVELHPLLQKKRKEELKGKTEVIGFVHSSCRAGRRGFTSVVDGRVTINEKLGLLKRLPRTRVFFFSVCCWRLHYSKEMESQPEDAYPTYVLMNHCFGRANPNEESGMDRGRRPSFAFPVRCAKELTSNGFHIILRHFQVAASVSPLLSFPSPITAPSTTADWQLTFFLPLARRVGNPIATDTRKSWTRKRSDFNSLEQKLIERQSPP
eukprot:gene1946-1184_t